MKMILSELSEELLNNQIGSRVYPKWWSLCLFRSLGMPTLNACFINANSTIDEINLLLLQFSTTIRCDRVLVRSDGGLERHKHPRGGLTLPVAAASTTIYDFSSENRAVVLLEPTNRFSNMLSINITVARELAWVAEALDCGFDTSDLQRNFVTPGWAWSGYWKDENELFRSKSIDIRGGVVEGISHENRVTQRLASIADLLSLGEGDDGILRAKKLLIESGNTCLFSQKRKEPKKRELLRVVNDAALILSMLGRASCPFTLSYAKIHDSRSVYWDIAFGKSKWAA